MENHNVSDFPKAMYRAPGNEVIEGHKCETRMVGEEAFEQAQADGWHETLDEALKAQAGDDGQGDGDGEPTREELVAKATELEIKFHPNTGSAKLLALIDEALKAKA